jgi:hydroxymethylglutaryl-CoA lyase
MSGQHFTEPADYGTTPRDPSMPEFVTVYEVGARDGLQNESTLVPVDVKVEFIRRLLAAGLPAVEATSFVHPLRVPQLVDADEVAAGLSDLLATHRLPMLVPNLRGLERALAAGAREIAVFLSATESFAKENLGTDLAGQRVMTEQVIAALPAGMSVRGYVSMCWGDPWEGAVAPAVVVELVRYMLDLGIREVSLGDTIGVASPTRVEELLTMLGGAGVPMSALAVHFHDTYGQALANTVAALRCGVSIVDSSAGGLGGCPFARSATGNLATEDLVWMLDGMGIRTGVDVHEVIRTSAWLSAVMKRPLVSRTATALAAAIAEADDRREH